MRNMSCVIVCCLLAGCERTDETTESAVVAHATAASVNITGDQPEVGRIAKSYRSLRAMTPEPVFVDPGLAMLCRGATQDEVEEARKKSGPHAHTAVMIFMNDAAAGSFGKPDATYPVGSIIVKEKSAIEYRPKAGSEEFTKANNGVGGMIKRPAGYDPAHGDWEYFYFEDVTKVESGKMKSCVECHRGAASKDYVFGG